MKKATSSQSNSINSPKTPGGISKSLLTPCRRLGLSRNWKKKGPSPFISPLASTPVVIEEKNDVRKRKCRTDNEENINNTPDTSIVDTIESTSIEIDKTPSRTVELPRRKKSKTLLSTINKSEDDLAFAVTITPDNNKNNTIIPSIDSEVDHKAENTDSVVTPVRTKSKKSKKHSQPKVIPIEVQNSDSPVLNIKKEDDNSTNNIANEPNSDHTYVVKERSPNDLSKECIVVIQRKIFKNSNNAETKENIVKNKDPVIKKEKAKTSQTLFDSDTDDVPLSNLNKNIIKPSTDNDNDFVETNNKPKEPKTKNVISPKNKMKLAKKKIKTEEKLTTKVNTEEKPTNLKSSFDDEDDDFDVKKTILVKKTYNKIIKPIKAKSTGSITQKDIDDLKARIEAKKRLLLAKAITPETEELRNLIKKWQKGCQDALMELMDLMKTKFNDKQNMNYSQMLDSLKIPHSLVGYDSEDDCFNSPDDATIILGQL